MCPDDYLIHLEKLAVMQGAGYSFSTKKASGLSFMFPPFFLFFLCVDCQLAKLLCLPEGK